MKNRMFYIKVIILLLTFSVSICSFIVSADQEKTAGVKVFDDDPSGPSSQVFMGKYAAEQKFKNMSASDKERLKSRLKRLKEMPPDKKKKVMEKFNEYQKLSERERTRLKNNWRHFKNMDPEKRDTLRKRWQGLSDEEKNKFKERRQKMKNMSLEQKQQFLKNKERWKNLSEQDRNRLREKHKNLRRVDPERLERIKDRREKMKNDFQGHLRKGGVREGGQIPADDESRSFPRIQKIDRAKDVQKIYPRRRVQKGENI